MDPRDTEVVYFAVYPAAIKIGCSGNLPDRLNTVRRTARALFGPLFANEDLYVIIGGTIDYEFFIHDKLDAHRVFRDIPKGFAKYEHCGYTEWFWNHPDVFTLMADCGARYLADGAFDLRELTI